MIRTHHHQPSLWTGILAEEVDDLWEPWMRRADRLLEDEQLIERVFEAQARRWLKSRTRGRRQTPAEVVLRLLILKHVRNWSYEVLEREVRANLVYRTFARSAPRRFRMPKHWDDWGRLWDRRWSPTCTSGWWKWR